MTKQTKEQKNAIRRNWKFADSNKAFILESTLVGDPERSHMVTVQWGSNHRHICAVVHRHNGDHILHFELCDKEHPDCSRKFIIISMDMQIRFERELRNGRIWQPDPENGEYDHWDTDTLEIFNFYLRLQEKTERIGEIIANS